MKQWPRICDRDRFWALSMLVDWKNGMGRPESRRTRIERERWIKRKMTKDEIEEERRRREYALNPEAPF